MRIQLVRGFRVSLPPHPPPLTTTSRTLAQTAPKPIQQTQTRLFRTTPRRYALNPKQTPPTIPSKPISSPATTTPSTRLDRVLSRIPRPLQKYTSRLRSAPVSHIVAFLILHELTAIIPLLGLFGLFHYASSSDPDSSIIPIGYMLEHYGSYVRDGVAKFERYFTKKGWFGFEQGQEASGGSGSVAVAGGVVRDKEKDTEDVLRRWESSDTKYRILVEVALAYALTKALLPVRIVASVSATPWFAGVLARLRLIGRRKR